VNVIDAAHKTVHSYPGGSESLGPRVGISPAVLRSKVNPNTTTHRLALEEADEIMGVTSNFTILQALAAKHGFGLVQLDEAPAATSVVSGILALSTTHGELSRVIHDAIADGVITEREMREISVYGTASQAALISLINLLRERAGKQPRAAA
jgi:hypothetical protein